MPDQSELIVQESIASSRPVLGSAGSVGSSTPFAMSLVTPVTVFASALTMLSISPAQADAALDKKCTLMAEVAKRITVDRDQGVPYATRLRRNDQLTADMPAMKDFLHGITELIYSDQDHITPSEAAVATTIGCMKGG